MLPVFREEVCCLKCQCFRLAGWNPGARAALGTGKEHCSGGLFHAKPLPVCVCGVCVMKLQV